MNKIIDLPKIVCGNIIYPTDTSKNTILSYTNGYEIRIPELTNEDVYTIINNREKLHDIPLSTVTTFLSNAGASLINPENALIKEACNYGSIITGYSC